VLPCLRATCWDHENRMFCRPFRKYSPARMWETQIPGRPNKGMPQNRGWAANHNTSSDTSRDGPHLCPASPLTSPSTQVSVRLSNELKYSQTLKTLHAKHPHNARPIYNERTLSEERCRRCVNTYTDIGYGTHEIEHLLVYGGNLAFQVLGLICTFVSSSLKKGWTKTCTYDAG
jgi:hypothetical protein